MTDADPEPLELGRNEQLTDSQMTESLTTSCGVSAGHPGPSADPRRRTISLLFHYFIIAYQMK
jgi:hypothetical protein